MEHDADRVRDDGWLFRMGSLRFHGKNQKKKKEPNNGNEKSGACSGASVRAGVVKSGSGRVHKDPE
jgi:hypothetical protein